MSSLKDKFQNFSEEPSPATWQTLLKRLNAEMPQRRNTRRALWILPFLIGVAALGLWQWMGTSPSSLPAPTAQTENPAAQAATERGDGTTSQQPIAAAQASVPAQSPVQSAVSPTGNASASSANRSSSRSTSSTPGTSGTSPHASNPVSTATPSVPAIADTIASPGVVVTSAPATSVPDSTPVAAANTPAPADSTVVTSASAPDSSANALPALRAKSEGGNFVLELYYGGGMSNMITSKPQKDGMSPKHIADGLALRKGTERAGFSFTTGVNVKYHINASWQIQTGYHFTQLKQNVYYNSDTAKCNCGTSIALTQASGKITTDQYGNNSDTISIGNTHSYTNQYNMREIPVLVSYAFPSAKNKNIHYSAGVGLSYMYFSGVDSRMADADNTGFLFTKNLNQFPFYRSTTSLLLNGGLTYSTHHNIDYMVAPQFKVALTDISNVPYWLRQYPWQFTIGVGVGKRF